LPPRAAGALGATGTVDHERVSSTRCIVDAGTGTESPNNIADIVPLMKPDL